MGIYQLPYYTIPLAVRFEPKEPRSVCLCVLQHSPCGAAALQQASILSNHAAQRNARYQIRDLFNLLVVIFFANIFQHINNIQLARRYSPD